MAAIVSNAVSLPDDQPFSFADFLNPAVLHDDDDSVMTDEPLYGHYFSHGYGYSIPASASGVNITARVDTIPPDMGAVSSHSRFFWSGNMAGDAVSNDQSTVRDQHMTDQSPTSTPTVSPETDPLAFTPTSSEDQEREVASGVFFQASNGQSDHNLSTSPQSTNSSWAYVRSPQIADVLSSSSIGSDIGDWQQHSFPSAQDDAEFQFLSHSTSAASSIIGHGEHQRVSRLTAAAPNTRRRPEGTTQEWLADLGSTGVSGLRNPQAAPCAPSLPRELTLPTGQEFDANYDHGHVSEYHSFSRTFHQHQDEHHAGHHPHIGDTYGACPPSVPFAQEQWHVPYNSDQLHSQMLSSVQLPSMVPAASLSPGRLENTTNRVIPILSSQAFPSTQRRPHGRGTLTAKSMARQDPLQVARAPTRRLQPMSQTIRRAVVSETTQRQGKAVRGGRKKGQRLDEETRQHSRQMRILGCCWLCAMQRDKCREIDEDGVCKRCRDATEKPHPPQFPCERAKLPDMVHEFLPPSMTVMHQKQSIEDTVKEQVAQWDQNWIEVSLTSGYGPPLTWRLHEFRPRSSDLLGQLQYLQDPSTRQLRQTHKYSPPLGLLKLDGSDQDHVETYLRELLQRQHLRDLGWTFYEEESQVDPGQFQARLLDHMCTLFMSTSDPLLQEILGSVLRMMVITYIMGHTLTIKEDTLDTVLDHIKLSPPVQRQQHTSPRLANRQLKFYFSVLRNDIYYSVLNNQQQRLKVSEKEKSWLQSFCATLGLAMVLEEVQRTIHIQADAKISKTEMTFEQATNEARWACERIDRRFQLMVQLFQYKYRDKRWNANGSFGPGTPYAEKHAERTFMENVRGLLEEKRYHLEGREKVPFAHENSCLYTSRLVARFLLPFLNLPRT